MGALSSIVNVLAPLSSRMKCMFPHSNVKDNV